MLFTFVANVFALCDPIMTFYVNVNITQSLLQHSVILSVPLFKHKRGRRYTPFRVVDVLLFINHALFNDFLFRFCCFYSIRINFIMYYCAW